MRISAADHGWHLIIAGARTFIRLHWAAHSHADHNGAFECLSIKGNLFAILTAINGRRCQLSPGESRRIQLLPAGLSSTSTIDALRAGVSVSVNWPRALSMIVAPGLDAVLASFYA